MIPTIFLRLHVYGNGRNNDLRALTEVYPEGRKPQGDFWFRLPDGDPRIELVERELHRLSIPQRPKPLTSEKMDPIRDRNYEKYRYHGYDDSDYANAEYFWIPDMDGGEWDLDLDGERHSDGMLAILAQSIPRRGQLMSSGPETFFASAAFKEELEAEQFVGVQFKPTKQVRDKYVNGEYIWIPHEPPAGRVVWEIFPTVFLPRMHREVTRLPPFNGGAYTEQGPGQFKNEGFDDVQLVYSRSALQQAGAFDIALTWEFTCRADQRPHIVSQRFYQFCKAKKIQARFVPVKIVEGE